MLPRFTGARVSRALVLLALLAPEAAAQQIRAVAAPTGALRLDGVLDEQVWAGAQPATGFLQRDPDEGAPASERTEVRFAYDEDALWIGARMFSADPGAIQTLMTRRDREGVAEQIVVSLDTYHDRRTAYSFAVTPGGVRIDYQHGGDFQFGDRGWDPVWETKTRIDEQGWTAEMRIPLTQLRFRDAPEQTWGVNLVRRIPDRNEASYWALVRRDETGWSSRMGELVGLVGLERSRGIELLPYVVGSAALTDVADPSNPFLDERSVGVRAGGDLKIQLGSSLTLDATLNPDFGQVEADPAEVNLSAFETFFGERRPFFSENGNLYNGRGLFYSRRIGGPALLTPDADHAERIDNTTILGAAKLGGRLQSGLSIGALAAVTDEEDVATFDEATGTFGRADVAPRAAYGVASVQQQFGADASTVSAMVAAVHRDLEPGSPLARAVTATSLSGMVETRLRWEGGKYDLVGWIGGAQIEGSPDALLSLQRSSRRYWQRPDADHVEVDPLRTTMAGTSIGLAHSKMSGDWLWDIDSFQRSPGLEPNDGGQLGRADLRGIFGNLRYRETDPGRWLRDWTVGVDQVFEWNFDWNPQTDRSTIFAEATLANFWGLGVSADYARAALSDNLTRGGPLMRTPAAWGADLGLSSRSGARTGWRLNGGLDRDEASGRGFRISPSLSLRPGPRWELSIDPSWSDRTQPRQYVTTRDGGPAATFGRRYLFAKVDRSEVAARMRLNYTFTPSLTLESYLEPFASSGTYHGFGELDAARSGDLRVYGEGGTTIVRGADGTRTVTADGETFTIANRDFNVRSLRSNVVLRWEWRPGSTAYLVWQQDGSTDRALGSVGPGDLFDAFGASPDQFFAIKLSYWLPIR